METVLFVATLAAGLFVYYLGQRYITIYHTLVDIPTVGPSGFFSTFAGIPKYILNAPEILQEGYFKHGDSLFKVYSHDGWVVSAGKSRLDEIRKASDDYLSFIHSLNRSLQIEFTSGPEIVYDSYHIQAIRGGLTRNIAIRFHDIRDEVIAALTDAVPISDEWAKVPTLPTAMEIFNRTAARMFVGFPLCRNRDYLKINADFGMEAFIAANILRTFPKFLRPLLSKVLRTNKTFKCLKGHLEPMLQYRLDQEEKYGNDWDGRPNDLISWLLDIAKGSQRSIHDLTLRVLSLTFAAIHTSASSLTHALNGLALHPQCVEPLREEIEHTICQEGWSKHSLDQMYKLDSFLKECQRFWGITVAPPVRMAMKDFTFSNGQTVSAGHDIQILAESTHFDETYYNNPHEFRPFRFSDMRQKEGHAESHQFVTLEPSWIAFGFGRHACPGRFFASNELKQALSHILMTYDIKLENETDRPHNKFVGINLVPDFEFKLLWRKRQGATG